MDWTIGTPALTASDMPIRLALSLHAPEDALRSEIVKLEESIRALLEKEEELLRDCSHTYAGGKSALVGGRVKVCVHCGRSVQGKDEKLWG